MKEWFEYLFLAFLIKIGNILPKKVFFALMKAFSLALFYLDKKRRILCIENLEKALKPKDSYEMAKKVYVEFSKTTAEIILLLNRKIDLKKIVINQEELKKIPSKKPILFVTAHFGNWEFLAHFLALNGIKLSVIGRKGNNRLIEKKITTPFREMFGNKNVYKEKALIYIAKALKKGENVGMLIDQKGGKGSLNGEFFSRKCKTISTPAILYERFDIEIVPIFLAREKDGFRLIVKKFNPLQNDKIAITNELNRILEDVIRCYPYQWFWMHNRWRN